MTELSDSRVPNQHCIACGGELRGKWQKKFCSRGCSSRHSRGGARPQRGDWNARYVPETGCWEWKGATKNGYGRTTIAYRGALVHRHFFEMYHRPLDSGEQACHACDNRLCFNPEHLFAGSAADNIADMVAKGRQATGERNAAAKLTADQAVAIRERRNGGASLRELADEFGVSISTISRIGRGDLWK